MARHYIEFRIWLAPTVDTGLVTAVANEIKDELNDFVRDAPVTIKDITYVIKRDEERGRGPTPCRFLTGPPFTDRVLRELRLGTPATFRRNGSD